MKIWVIVLFRAGKDREMVWRGDDEGDMVFLCSFLSFVRSFWAGLGWCGVSEVVIPL
jgi:hypothetical protein